MKLPKMIFLLILVIVTTRCSSQPNPKVIREKQTTDNVVPVADSSDAIDLAVEFAKQQGRKIEGYKITSVRFRRGEWIILFEGIPPESGHHFKVGILGHNRQSIVLYPGM